MLRTGDSLLRHHTHSAARPPPTTSTGAPHAPLQTSAFPRVRPLRLRGTSIRISLGKAPGKARRHFSENRLANATSLIRTEPPRARAPRIGDGPSTRCLRTRHHTATGPSRASHPRRHPPATHHEGKPDSYPKERDNSRCLPRGRRSPAKPPQRPPGAPEGTPPTPARQGACRHATAPTGCHESTTGRAPPLRNLYSEGVRFPPSDDFRHQTTYKRRRGAPAPTNPGDAMTAPSAPLGHIGESV